MNTQLMCITLAAVALGGALLVAEDDADAFPFTFSWHQPAAGELVTNRAGAEGIYGLGSPNDFGIRCDHCHVDVEANFTVDIAVSPPFNTLGNDRLYVAGQTYDIQISIVGETKGLKQASNLNGFAASFETADGTAMGVLTDSQGARSDSCPPNDPGDIAGNGRSLIYGDCHGVVFVPEDDDVSWTFSWTAPSAGAGNLTMFYGVVDGDHHGKSSLGDDSVQGQLLLLEE